MKKATVLLPEKVQLLPWIEVEILTDHYVHDYWIGHRIRSMVTTIGKTLDRPNLDVDICAVRHTNL